MRRTKPTFGHAEVVYRLGEIFKRTAKEFEEADAADRAIENECQCTKETLSPLQSIKMTESMFAASARRMEAGVVLLMTAAALLEQIINDYAHTFLDPESYEEHIGNARIVTKWVLLPKLCQNKEIQDDEPAINSLRELVKARNAIVHRKRKEMYLNPIKASNQTSAEIARFLSACRKAESTVDALKKVLTCPPPGGKKPETDSGKENHSPSP